MTKKEKFNNFIENAALKTGDVNIESMLKNNKENLNMIKLKLGCSFKSFFVN